MKARNTSTPAPALKAALLDPAFARVSKHEDTPAAALKRAAKAGPANPLQAALLRALPR
jgi:hypothetical protein